jgi:putative transposase
MKASKSSQSSHAAVLLTLSANPITKWETLQHLLPPLPKRDRPPTHSQRAIFNAIFYVLRTGCSWRYLPINFPPWQTVFCHFRRLRFKRTWTLLLRNLHQVERER